MKKVFLLIVLCCTVGCNNVASNSDVIDDGSAESVSLVDLIVNARKFESKRVSAFGYLGFYGSTRLFLTKGHADGGDHASSIGVTDPTAGGTMFSSGCMGSYVHVHGTVTRSKYGVYSISGVSKIFNASDMKVCWEKE